MFINIFEDQLKKIINELKKKEFLEDGLKTSNFEDLMQLLEKKIFKKFKKLYSEFMLHKIKIYTLYIYFYYLAVHTKMSSSKFNEFIYTIKKYILKYIKKDNYIHGTFIISDTNQYINNYDKLNKENSNNKDIISIIEKYFFEKIYINDRAEIFKHLYFSDIENIYIDTVILKKIEITVDDINKLIEDEQGEQDIIEVYNFIYNSINSKNDIHSIDLFSQPIKIYPIVNDFLRYNSENVSNIRDTDKDTRAKLIVEKSHNVEKVFSSKCDKKNLSQVFSHNSDRRSVKVNFLIEKSVIDRIYKIDTVEINNPYFPLLNKYNKYSYQNFENQDNDSFSFLNKGSLVVAARYSNIIQKNDSNSLNYPIEYRVISNCDEVNIVGFLFSRKQMKDIRLKDIKNIKIDNNIYKSIQTFFENYYYSTDSYYLIFDLSKIFNETSSFLNNTQRLQNFSNNIIKILIKVCFNKLKKFVNANIKKIKNLNTMMNYLKKIYMHFFNDSYFKKLNYFDDKKNSNNFTYLYQSILNYYTKSNINTESSVHIPDVKKYINYYRSVKSSDVNIKNYMLKDKIAKLNYKKKKYNKSDNYICEHVLRRKDIDYLKYLFLKNSSGKFSDKYFKNYISENDKFTNKFHQSIDNDHFTVCKSCGEMIQVKYELNSGRYDSYGTYTSDLAPIIENMSDILIYNKNPLLVKYISNYIENMGNIFQLSFSGGISYIQISKIKEILNFIRIQNILLEDKEYKIYRVELRKKYNIDKSIIYTLPFNDTLIIDSNKTNLKISVIYLAFTFLYEVTIDNIQNYKYINPIIKSYADNKNKIFSNFKFDFLGITEKLINYDGLCFGLYLLSYIILEKNMWGKINNNISYKKKKDFIPDISEQYIIICSLYDIIVSIKNINDFLEKNKENINNYKDIKNGCILVLTKIKMRYINIYSKHEFIKIIDINNIEVESEKKNIEKRRKLFLSKVNKTNNNIYKFKKNIFKTYYGIKKIYKQAVSNIIVVNEELNSYYKSKMISDMLKKKNTVKNTVIDNNKIKYYYAEKNKLMNNYTYKEGRLEEHGKKYYKYLKLKKIIEEKQVSLESFIEEFISKLKLKKNESYTINHSYLGNSIEQFDVSKDQLVNAPKDAYEFFKEENIVQYHNKKKNLYLFYNLITLNYLGYYNIKIDRYYIINKDIKLIFNNGFLNIIYNLGIPDNILNKKIKKEFYYKNYKELILLRVNNIKNILRYAKTFFYVIFDRNVSSSYNYLKKFKLQLMNNNIKNKLWFNDVDKFINSIDTNFKYMANISKRIKVVKMYKNISDIKLLIIYLLKKILDILEVNNNKKVVLISAIKYFFISINRLYSQNSLLDNTLINSSNIVECINMQKVYDKPEDERENDQKVVSKVDGDYDELKENYNNERDEVADGRGSDFYEYFQDVQGDDDDDNDNLDNVHNFSFSHDS